ncbi:DUF2179 domain-containing protein [Natranaerofaba carboxydovora]|uniref:DUF2179 domain-containing protein n=1 Tax=Natranaerofaba carboxydovora TaxID=2742683 RepID=UPI001F144E3B|nr:DUF2179 domain-containing protein [Natranaerofaba carboxydovora]
MPLVILLINVTYVSLLTVRTMLTLKGQTYPAAAVSAFEVLMFVLGLGLVMDNLGEIQNLAAYAIGFALGIIVGAKIESKLALGYATVKVISKYYNCNFPQYLRKEGFGVTSWVAKGGAGKRLVMEVLTSRKDQHDLYNYVLAFDPNAFIISHEPQHFRGGFWLNNLKKYAKKHGKNFNYPEDNFPDIDEEVVEQIQEDSDYIDEEVVKNYNEGTAVSDVSEETVVSDCENKQN